ncbi:MAG: ribosomal protein S18-alanine N-acetyltransferase [Halofilum sp. (in: g-proteobacteria)]|nr:ribosomal protein S18-alanine N-acetyltransferase [Halofilum sp. (in: g-proteobacteria)]
MVAVLQPGPAIRPMVESDLVAVLAVEQASYPYPWSRRIFEDCLRVGYCCLVAVTGAGIVGHGIMLARAGEAHILNLCVHPDARRAGIARALLGELLDVARGADSATAFLEVRPTNEGAVELYEGAGFRVVGRRKDYYPAPFGREDALVMALRLDEA